MCGDPVTGAFEAQLFFQELRVDLCITCGQIVYNTVKTLAEDLAS